MDFTSKFDYQESGTCFDGIILRQVIDDLSAPLAGRVDDIQPLSGGYRNTNLKIIPSNGEPFVLRISNNPLQQFEAEISVLKALKPRVPVPAVYACRLNHPALNGHVALLEYLPGTLLSTAEDSLNTAEIRAIARNLGQILAIIHSFTFRQSGFLGKGFRVAEPFPDFFQGYDAYLQKYLENRLLAQRLPPAWLKALKALADSRQETIKNLTRTTSLVHSDFNQKNILVNKQQGRWEVTGILDWEFAFSGCPLIDPANFFRFEEEMPEGYREAFTEAYRENGGCLEANWRQTARFLDLLAMLEFLTRKGEYPKTFATTRAVIKKTLSLLA